MSAPGAAARVPLIGFAAPSGTGKTTLLITLIPLLRAQGLRIGVIKHAHHAFAIDKPGKDSYELRAAGAATVMLSAAGRRATISELPDPRDPDLAEEVRHFDTDGIDLILVEGFKHERFPKIELLRPALGSWPMFPHDDSIVAIATDGPLPVPATIPVLDLNRPEQIADFIRQRLT